MSDSGCGSADCSVIVVTLIVGATVFVLYYISSLLRSSKEEENAKNSEVVVEQKEKVSTHNSAPKASKKNKQEKWGRDSKQRFAHPWLLTSLKGHTGKVLDMDFSSNGKFLATCAEVPPSDGNFGVYALDCEMCFTTRGLELTKVTVVAADGRLVYDCLVRPENFIIDYNTRFSGITARDLSKRATKTLKDVQNDLMGFINADTILIGHGLENDLRALQIIHGTVIDTSVVFPHYWGLPYRRSLKSLVGCLLKRDIQQDSSGHDSFEDARACIELMLWRIRKDFRSYTNPRLNPVFSSLLYCESSASDHVVTDSFPDRAILIWSTKDWHQNDHKSLRINVEFDHASFVKWSPDSKAFIVQKVRENAVEVYKVNKRPDGWIGSVSKALTFPKHEGWDAVVGLGIACNGKFIMSCSDKTDLVLWDLKGQQLAKVDTYLMNNYCARISPCGRFVAASGFTPDVKVWEVCFAKSGEFHQVSRAFELSGHSSGVYDFSFNADSSCIATVSKDGTWKAYNTKIYPITNPHLLEMWRKMSPYMKVKCLFCPTVEFQKGEDPHLLITGKYNHKSAGPSHVAISPNGEVVVVADGGSLSFYSVLTGECDNTIRDIYSGDIVCVQFDSLGKFVLAAGDKHVHVFHNVTGYRATIASIQAKFKQATMSSAQKERMGQQIQEARDFLKSLKEQSS
uniref:Exonuclease domain-containing protein n=1 Tax=Timema monikensis TaxID=170555 RepID=A0A7R9E2I1_9NEOP|nr:unnamed protein product [Timema monikensis]